jgi:outer membrane usher protein
MGWMQDTTPRARNALDALRAAVCMLGVAWLLATPVAGAVEYAKPVTGRINTTGRPVHVAVPLKEGDRVLGEIVITITPGDAVLLPKGVLIERLDPLLGAWARRSLQSIREHDGVITLADLREAGFRIEFDRSQLELSVRPSIDQRAIGDLSLAAAAPAASAAAVPPARVAGYLNVLGSIDQQWGVQPGKDALTGARLDFTGVLRSGNAALEANASYDGAVDTAICALGWVCNYRHTAGFKRRDSRLTWDLPEQEVRVQAGDTYPLGIGYQRSVDMLGISIEKSPRKLNPGENIRPTGRSSFQIERPASVDIVINGAVMQRLHLSPGNYNIRDIPFTVGANEVELIIADDTGARRAMTFTTFYGSGMLASGRSEWALAGGVPSYLLDDERRYATDSFFVTALHRYGLSDAVTLELDAQSDDRVRLFGAGMLARTQLGVWGVQPALSVADTGIGFAGTITWDLAGVRGIFAARESLRISADIRSPQFRQPGDLIDFTGGIYKAAFAPYRLRLTADYTFPLPGSVMATLSGRYQIANDDAVAASPFVVRGDRYGCDLTLSKPITPWVTASLTGGYSNERYLQTLVSGYQASEPEFRAMLRLFIRPRERSTITASYDSLSRIAHVNAYDTTGSGIGRWETSVNVQQDGYQDRAAASASVAHFANRYEVRVTHAGGFGGVGYDGFAPVSTDERTSIRVGTAIAFADGKVALGQPIRNGGFAIVAPHESLAGREVVVGDKSDVRARTGALGPVIVANLPEYTPTSIAIDVPDAPIGYSLGSGTFDLYPPYKGGYALEVGSSHAVTAYGTLQLANGEVLAARSGVAVSADNPGRQVQVFTNSVGRFAADGLAAGSWRLRMDTEVGQQDYVLDVPEGVVGLHKVGTLRPADMR